MFVCEYCVKSFSRKDALNRHGDCRPTSKICEHCNGCFKSEGVFQRHVKEKHPTTRVLKRNTDSLQQPNAKRPRLHSTSELQTLSTRYCGPCKLSTPTAYWNAHLKTSQHQRSSCIEEVDGVQIMQTSFKNRVATYRLASSEYSINIKQFLESLRSKVIRLIAINLRKFIDIKVGMELYGRFLLQTKENCEIKSFNSKFQLVFEGANLEELYEEFIAVLDKKASEFAEKDSGWTLQQLLYLDVCINKVNPTRASSYLALPKEIESRKAVVNIKNTDNKCFMWSVLAALHPVPEHAYRVSKYLQFENELNFSGMKFPISLKDICKFERLNNISINVYGLDRVYTNDRYGIEVVGPLYFTQSKKETHVNLLIISNNNGNNHYCLIRSMSRLITSQLSSNTRVKYLCDGCLVYFYCEYKLKEHQKNDCSHVAVKLPSTDLKKNKYGENVPGNLLKFVNFDKKLKVPFVVYADFETVLEAINTKQNDLKSDVPYTLQTHKNIPYSFGYYIKCDFDDSLSSLKIYRGSDAHKVFVKWLESDCKLLYNKYLKQVLPMTALSVKQEQEFSNATICHICEQSFNEISEKVKDHCHLKGTYRGAAHSICNLNYKIPNFIPIFFHNMSGFDSHLFVKELALENERIDVIPQNKERYISFTKHVLVENIEDEAGKLKNTFLQLRFLDSFRFMASSLDNLSKNLKPAQCREIRKFFPVEEEFQLIRQKGVFPYSYVDSISKLEDTKLPSPESFYNAIRKESVTLEDYERAQKVWNLFKCQTLGQYSDIYLKSDVLILADVFESFREVCLATYALDPCQYFTAPALSLDAALKSTKVTLELLTDIDMIHFFKHGIRGGVSQCSARKAVANNQFLPHYDDSKPTSYIMYLDATNLYGAAMSQYLPTGNFRWLEKNEIENLDYMNIALDSNKGYILEVDLDYPKELHYLHNELPFCPESIIPPKSKTKIPKLIPNLYKKEKYVIHYKNLQQALRNGLKLIKIHRVLCFDQYPWLKQYIDLNTAKRNAAENKFEKNFFKLMNNAVFGKTMENVEKRVDIKLITHWENIGRKEGAEALIAKPHFKNVSIFSENLVAIHMGKKSVLYNKPIYAGFCILDIAKTILYDFLYGYIKPKYGNNAILLYTDTDSLILQIFTDNFYNDMKENLNKFDTSNYPQDNQHNLPVNKSILGNMKDEYAGKVLSEFYGTGAKAYCVNVGGELTKKAKGIPDYVTKKELTIDDYKRAASVEGTQIYKEMNSFRTHLHNIYLELKNKVALSYADDKRCVIPNSEYTLAWGHRDSVLNREISEIP